MRLNWKSARKRLLEKAGGSEAEAIQTLAALQRDFDALLKIARRTQADYDWPIAAHGRGLRVYRGIGVFVWSGGDIMIATTTERDFLAFTGMRLDDGQVFALPTIKGYSNPIRREVKNGSTYEYYYRRLG